MTKLTKLEKELNDRLGPNAARTFAFNGMVNLGAADDVDYDHNKAAAEAAYVKSGMGPRRPRPRHRRR